MNVVSQNLVFFYFQSQNSNKGDTMTSQTNVWSKRIMIYTLNQLPVIEVPSNTFSQSGAAEMAGPRDWFNPVAEEGLELHCQGTEI